MQLYNATQTTHPEKVAKFTGRMYPTWAVTGKQIVLSENLLTKHSPGTNMWLRPEDIEAIGLTLQPNAEGFPLYAQSTRGKGNLITFYAIESVIEHEKLIMILQREHFAASTGIRYTSREILQILARDSLEKGFESGIWATKAKIDELGVRLRENEKPTTIPSAGAATSAVYNADQLVNAKPLLDYVNRMQCPQISGNTGKVFPLEASKQLAKIRAKNPGWSRYWFTLRAAAKQQLNHASNKAVFVYQGSKRNLYLNASQLKPYVLFQCIETHRKVESALRGHKIGLTFDGQKFAIASQDSTYSAELLEAIVEASSDKNCFDWLTADFAAQIGAIVKVGAAPLIVEGKKGSVYLYTADQLIDRSLLDVNAECKRPQACGLTGTSLPKEVAEKLVEVAKKRPFFSRFWMPLEEAIKNRMKTDGQTTMVADAETGEKTSFVNLSEMYPTVQAECMKKFGEGKCGENEVGSDGENIL